MKVTIPKTTELISSNVPEAVYSDWATATTYAEGNKVYVRKSTFPELTSYGNGLYDTFTKGTGWTYDATGSAYDCDGTQTAVSQLTQQNSTIVGNDLYLCEFEIQARSAGEVAVFIGGAAGTGTSRTAVGWYQEVIKAGTTTKTLGITADADFVGTVSNISFKKVGRLVQRDIYESLEAANTGNFPPVSTEWVKVTASNRWKMFDDTVGSQTEQLENITVKIKANKSDVMAFFLAEALSVSVITTNDSQSKTSATSNTIGAGNKTFTIGTLGVFTSGYVEIYRTNNPENWMFGEITSAAGTDIVVNVTHFEDYAAAGPYTDWTISQVLKYDSDTSLYQASVVSWSDYFFSPIRYSTSKTFSIGLSQNTSCRIIFTGADDQMVRVGHLLVGKGVFLGKTQYGLSAGITDFSVKQVNEFGEYTLVQRSFAQEIRYTIFVETGAEDQVYQTLAQTRAIPCVWDANNEGTSLSLALVFGFFNDFQAVIPDFNLNECELEIQGLA